MGKSRDDLPEVVLLCVFVGVSGQVVVDAGLKDVAPEEEGDHSKYRGAFFVGDLVENLANLTCVMDRYGDLQ